MIKNKIDNTINEETITTLIDGFVEEYYKFAMELYVDDKKYLNNKDCFYKEIADRVINVLNTCYKNGELTKSHIDNLYWGHVRIQDFFRPRQWVFLDQTIVKRVLGFNEHYAHMKKHVSPFKIEKVCNVCNKKFVVIECKSRSDLFYWSDYYWNKSGMCPNCIKEKKESDIVLKEKLSAKIIENISQPLQNLKTTDFSKSYNELLQFLKYMPYEEYLQTEHWLHFREEALKWAQNKCQLCSKTYSLNVHHKTYDNRGRETFNDVIILCKDCHAKFHDKVV